MRPHQLVAAVLTASCLAQHCPEGTAASPPDPAGIAGARILGGGGRLPAAVLQRFVELAGGTAADIVLVPTAGEQVDQPEVQQRIAASWQRDFPQAKFTVVHTRDRAVADSEEFAAPLRRATGLWFGGGVQQRIADAYLGTRFEREVMALCARGGVVGGTSAGTAIQSRTMIQEGRDPPTMSIGLDLVPGAIVDQHFAQRQREGRLLQALAGHRSLFGLGVDESTAVEIQGRTLSVLGEGHATLLLAEVAGRPARRVVMNAGERQDLVTWQRAARARADAPWPPSPMAAPGVVHGALVIVGGGMVPAAALERFVALAGGKTARIVVVPSAAPPTARHRDQIVEALHAAGVADVRTFDAAHPREVTAEALAVLADATGIWFGGGRQWRLCDAFEGTAAIAAFAAVLARGGVIGGSSAGATIQGEFLVRGNPLGNEEEWCEGYERGFAYLPGCAIDQHFVARHREADLAALVARLPQLIGLGIDEDTAIVVQGSMLEVVGDSKVAVFDVRHGDDAARAAPQPNWLEPGARWDLAAGRRIER